MQLPPLDTYGYNPDAGPCKGWAWSNNSHFVDPLQRDLMREVEIDFYNNTSGTFQIMSDNTMLVSHVQAALSAAAPSHNCGNDNNRRVLPHTILKHTIVFEAYGVAIDSISWVYDHTRGRMRNYPFCGGCSAFRPGYDVLFCPIPITDPAGHYYTATSNDSWVGNITPLQYGTANYFLEPEVDPNVFGYSVWPSGSNQLFNPANFNPINGEYVLRLPPYALFEAPMLAHNGQAYAGYEDVSGVMQPAFWNDPTADVPWTFVIDKPIDLLLINPSEQIIYNPSEAVIDIPGSTPAERTLVFPSGYTFKTVHGEHPSEAIVLSEDPESLYPHPLLAPVPSTLGPNSSEYIVKAGSHLIIEPCVTLMDVTITVEAGATVTWYSDALDGNFDPATDFIWADQVNSDNEQTVGPATKPCPANCYDITFYDHKDLTIQTTQSWSTNNIPPAADMDQDGILRIAGTLRIEAGVTLNIDDVNIEFGPNGRMIIERGAHVITNGATFTSACSTMWEGIEIWGTKDVPQLWSNNDQGWLKAYYTTFENARLGVAVFKNSFVEDVTHNGGVFRAQNCTFTNNYRDVWIKPSVTDWNGIVSPNQCYFLNTTFQTTDYLLDPNYASGPDRKAAETHVELEGVHRIIFTNCTFSTQLPGGQEFLPHFRSTGIEGFQAAFHVQNSDFNGLTEGIVAYGTPANAYVQKFHNNTFTGTIQNIVLEAMDYARITGNTILLPPTPNYGYMSDDIRRGYDQPVGIFALGSSYFHIEGNTITGQASGTEPEEQYSYAMVICDAAKPADADSSHGEGTGYIYRNTLNGVNIALQCERDNQGFQTDVGDPATNIYGLFIECNEFGNMSDVYQYDITVVGDFISQFVQYPGRLRDQGRCINNATQAGNSLSNCANNDNDNIFFSGGPLTQYSRDEFEYADQVVPVMGCHNLPNTMLEPQLFQCDQNLGQRNCPILLNCGLPCLTIARAEHNATIKSLQDSLDITQDPALRKALQTQIGYWKGRMALVDNDLFREKWWNEGLDSAIVVLEKGEEEYQERKLIPMYMEKRDYTTAMTLLIQLENKEQLPNERTELLRMELEKRMMQQTIKDIDQQEEQELKNKVEQDESGAHNSKVVLRYAKGVRYARYPMPLNDTNAGYRGASQEDQIQIPEALLIIPNPAKTLATLIFPVIPNTKPSVLVWDVTGKQHLLNAQVMDAGRIQLDLRTLSSGTYFVQVQLGERVWSGKMLVLP